MGNNLGRLSEQAIIQFMNQLTPSDRIIRAGNQPIAHHLLRIGCQLSRTACYWRRVIIVLTYSGVSCIRKPLNLSYEKYVFSIREGLYYADYPLSPAATMAIDYKKTGN